MNFIGKNSIIKMRKIFLNAMLKLSYRYREIVRKPKRFLSVMTSMTKFTQRQNQLTSNGFGRS